MKQFPVVKASGNNYEVGMAIGKTMRQPIGNLLEKLKEKYKDLTPQIKTSRVFVEQSQKYFHQYVRELKGIADGASVSFDELFLTNCWELFDYSGDHCTIIAIPKDDGYILGHNEDWNSSALELMYILDATVNGMRIFGLNYADSLVGCSVAINGHGLIEAVNEVSHEDAQVGIPKKFIARAILDCQTLEEAEVLMQTIPRAAGYNHVLVQGNRLWNIESSAKEYVIEKIDHQKYVHTNHYLTELKRIDTEKSEETKLRYNKVKGLIDQINTVDDMKRILSDRNDPKICREGTIGSVIFDTFNKTNHIAYGQPTPESYYKISI